MTGVTKPICCEILANRPPHRFVYVFVRNAAQTFVDAARFALILAISINSRGDYEMLEY
jgi:hypothetical protein